MTEESAQSGQFHSSNHSALDVNECPPLPAQLTSATCTPLNRTDQQHLADPVIGKFHYTGPTKPDQTKSADFVGDPGLVGPV